MSPYFIFFFLVAIASGAFSLQNDLKRQRGNSGCGVHGYLYDCASACEPSCSTYKMKNMYCTDECVTACKCDRGFVIDDDSRLCVATKYCKKPKSN